MSEPYSIPNRSPREVSGSRRGGGFTLIELLVAIGVSVVLLAILTFVFQVSTTASRDANSRVSLTERLRSLNLRLRQEVSGMVHKVRDNLTIAYPFTYEMYRCFGLPEKWPIGPPFNGADRGHNILAFTTSTVQDGKPVTVDVCYIFQPGGYSGNPVPEQGRLIRLRDRTGPEAALDPVGEVKYQLGDDRFWALNAGASRLITLNTDVKNLSFSSADMAKFNKWIYSSDVMMINVRNVEFFAVDPPPVNTETQLNPRTLPAGIKMVIVFGPEVGNIDQMQRAEIFFPVQRGL
jgi:prepilin-type N-terminal cleavage/methylation domain-containing protein